MISPSERVLIADVGGTSVRFALATRHPERPDHRPDIEQFWKTPGDDHASFSDALSVFTEHVGELPRQAVIGVAGPVINQSARLTNRPWTIDAELLSARFGFVSVSVINDFVAMARAAPILTDDEAPLLLTGKAAPNSNIVVCGPGTGLGLATVGPLGLDWYVLGGEGGHQAFCPQTDLEIQLLKKLQPVQGYVSHESVCAGIKFPEVLSAIQDIYGRPREPLTPQALYERAKAGDDMANDLCQLRANVAMTALGNAVLAAAARGGAWLAGGVANLLQDYFPDRRSHQSFFVSVDR